MKKTLIFLVALLPAIVPAVPFDSLSHDAQAELLRQNWGNREFTMSPEAAKFVDEFLNQMQELNGLLEACRDRQVFIRPAAAKDALDKLERALRAVKKTTYGFDDKVEDVKRALGHRRANHLVGMTQVIDRTAKRDLAPVVDYVITYCLVQLYDQWKDCIRTEKRIKLTKKFKEIDAGWLKFKNAVDTMSLRRTGQDVSGSELLMLSGLDKYFDSDLEIKSEFSFWVNIVDRYNEEVFCICDEYRKRIKDLRESNLPNAIARFGEAYDGFQEEMAGKMYGQDRVIFDKYFMLWSTFFEDLQKMLDESWEMIMEADDRSGTEVAQLRRCRQDFFPNGSFLLAGPSNKISLNYKRRIRVIAEDLRKRYMKHLENLRKWYPNDPRIPKRWE